MTVLELKSTCINGTQVYLDWLIENDKGLQTIDINSITTKDKIHYKFKLSSKLFDSESILIRHVPSSKDYSDLFKIIEYDADKRVLILKKDKEFPFEISNEKRDNIKIVSSLRFLVQNIIDWYQQNGDKLKLPTQKSPLFNSSSKIEFENNTSNEQKEAIKMIFEAPFSYVWGAPGTGKTRWVLTQAMLQYINQGKQIAILAPTNNAIEQVLEAIIPIAQKKGIPLKKFIRLGNPSSKFSELYPDICEIAGLEKQLKQIDSRIDFLNRHSSSVIEQNKIQTAKTSKLLVKYESSLGDYLLCESKKKEQKQTIKELDEKLDNLRKGLKNQKQGLLNVKLQRESLINKIGAFFGLNNRDYDSEIKELDKSCDTSNQQIINTTQKIDIEKQELDKINIHSYNLDLANQTDYKEVLNTFSFLFDENESHLKHPIKISRTEIEIKSRIEKRLSKFESDALLALEYSNLDAYGIEKLILELKEKRDNLAAMTTAQRLESVSVVACTLDSYIMRFVDTHLTVNHIFVDEAGYANALKTLPLFINNIPVTLLGDHKQLPPVCELNDFVIEKDKTFYDAYLWHYTSTCIDSLFVQDKNETYSNFVNKVQLTKNQMLYNALRTTYRFGSNLAKVLGDYIYSIDFKSGSTINNTEIFYINAPKRMDELRSRKSDNEINAIMKLVVQLDASNEEYAILSPYRKGQLYQLSRSLPNQRDNEQILTVHGSQGREWNTVILSVVDTSDMYFTNTSRPNAIGRNLINTAVSRAKKRLIIVADTHFWLNQHNQLISELLRIGKEIEI
ncbi:AAA domain-containing protein [Aestuariibaculum sp. M13]|uniref:AAA domain-containing protein n=1 Tax=Aestuariibaculum sp. M13 TaxID=2967132 RepID=UPI002159CE32|nr:AAA domain-containing protein [Aestuariibaculum sp. M13]MCR8667943.1 AAA domain-containing protein [Aestuariibaculum sp. M13]